MRQAPKIAVEVTKADALEFDADVLVLKYAQSLYGVDRAVYDRLSEVRDVRLPKIDGFTLHDTGGCIKPRFALFVGVKTLREFGYAEIREFARKALPSLAGEMPGARHVALTLHGPGYGLDENEAFEAELAGLLEAVNTADFPGSLERISFIEQNGGRAERMLVSIQKLLPNGIPAGGQRSVEETERQINATLRSAGYASAAKPHVFVAMPFAREMDDVFYYGIQGAVNGAGMLCERADLSSFTGDVMEWVKRRISTSTIVIADLSNANPNVYLEVGYAWGCRITTVLLVKDTAHLKFDVRGHRCIAYESIRELEEKLKRELQSLSESGAAHV